MTLKTKFNDLVSELKDNGYKVSVGPQEHVRMEVEVWVDIEDVEMDLESPSTYDLRLRVIIGLIARDRTRLLDELEKLIPIVDGKVEWIEDIGVSVEGEYILATFSVIIREIMEV